MNCVQVLILIWQKDPYIIIVPNVLPSQASSTFARFVNRTIGFVNSRVEIGSRSRERLVNWGIGFHVSGFVFRHYCHATWSFLASRNDRLLVSVSVGVPYTVERERGVEEQQLSTEEGETDRTALALKLTQARLTPGKRGERRPRTARHGDGPREHDEM
jgi:hypothetical protein